MIDIFVSLTLPNWPFVLAIIDCFFSPSRARFPTDEWIHVLTYLFVHGERNKCTGHCCARVCSIGGYTHTHASPTIYLFDDISGVYSSRKPNWRTGILRSPFFVELRCFFRFFRIFFIRTTDQSILSTMDVFNNTSIGKFSESSLMQRW